jgi:hypothetical protein
VSELLVDALLAAWRGIRERLSWRAQPVVDWVRDAAQPPVGVTLTAPDGSVYTGIAVVERNRLVVLFAFRERGVVSASSYGSQSNTRGVGGIGASASGIGSADVRSPGAPFVRSSLSLWEHERRSHDELDGDDWRR